MGFHGNPVAVLDMKSDQVLPFDKCDIEGMNLATLDLSDDILNKRNRQRLYPS
jgi:hypothetical protein